MNCQVSSLLHALRIDNVLRPAVPPGSHLAQFEGAWQASSSQPMSSRQVAENWANEFGPRGWAEEYSKEREEGFQEVTLPSLALALAGGQVAKCVFLFVFDTVSGLETNRQHPGKF